MHAAAFSAGVGVVVSVGAGCVVVPLGAPC